MDIENFDVDVQINFSELFVTKLCKKSMCFPDVSLAPYFLKGITCNGIDAMYLTKQPTSDLSFQNILLKELYKLV